MNGKGYALGEKVSYKVTVTNDGNLTLKNVEVKDDHFGAATGKSKALPAVIETLGVGESVEFTYTYTIKEADLGKNLKNIVTVTADDPTQDPDDPDYDPNKKITGTDEEEVPVLSKVDVVRKNSSKYFPSSVN